MSFLDHFRRKPSELANTPATQPRNAEQKIAANEVDERSSPAPTAGPHDTGTAQAPVREEKPTPVAPEPKSEETRIRVCVGDFLHRIPHQLLKPGQHDITFEVCFDAADVADRIAQGHTTIALVEVYKRAPHIFRREIREADNVEIRFPWQKLMSFIKPETGISKGQAVRPAAA